MANRFINPNPQFLDNDAEPLSSGTLSFYLTGSSTPAATYIDAALGTTNSWPIPLNSAGRPTESIFLSPTVTYKVVLTNATGTVIWTEDPVVDPAANVTAAVQVYPGNPNGNVAGNQGTLGGSGASMIWDITNNLLYICTTTGSASTAVWTSTTATLAGAVQLTGVITPAALSGNQDNYNPAGGASASEWRIDLSANVDITGFGSGVAGRILITPNVSTSNYIRFCGESAPNTASTAANRLDIPGYVTVGPRQCAFWQYDAVQSRWKLIAATGYSGRTVLVDAATVAWDLSTGRDFEVTLGGARTLGAFTKGTVGQNGFLLVKQDGTGGRSLAMTDPVYDFPGNNPAGQSAGVNEEAWYAYLVTAANTAMQIRRIGGAIGEGGRDLLSAQTAAVSATIDFVLTKWLTLYDRFEVDFDNVLAATDNDALWMRTSTDGGSTYSAGAANYSWRLLRLRNTVSDTGIVNATDTTLVIIPPDNTCGLSNVATETASGTVKLHSPTAVGKFKAIWSSVHYPATAAEDFCRVEGSGIRNTSADVDAIRFLCSTGNITSGTFRLYGVRK